MWNSNLRTRINSCKKLPKAKLGDQQEEVVLQEVLVQPMEKMKIRLIFQNYTKMESMMTRKIRRMKKNKRRLRLKRLRNELLN